MKRTNHKMICEAVLFDLDGVLIDSTDCIIRHWKEWALDRKIDLNELLNVTHGIRTIETIRAVAPHLNAEEETRVFTENEISDTNGVMEIDGAKDLLNSLGEMKWAIVTSGSQKLARARLMSVSLPVPGIIVSGDDVVKGKPFPEPYLLGAEKLGVSPCRCVVIEDSPAGVEAGEKCGMSVIGVETTHSGDELYSKGADMVVSTVKDLNVSKYQDSAIKIEIG